MHIAAYVKVVQSPVILYADSIAWAQPQHKVVCVRSLMAWASDGDVVHLLFRTAQSHGICGLSEGLRCGDVCWDEGHARARLTFGTCDSSKWKPQFNLAYSKDLSASRNGYAPSPCPVYTMWLNSCITRHCCAANVSRVFSVAHRALPAYAPCTLLIGVTKRVLSRSSTP